ncbi:MAG: hypothetical protein J7K75_06935 [Desulfuromonas sp.]|nr:hypothetical protein [Desulfuromonas sp.]
MQQTLHTLIDSLFNFTQLPLLLVSVMMLLFAVSLLRQQRRIRFEIQRREEADRQLLNALQRITKLEDSLDPSSSQSSTFERSLDHAELKSRLQTPVTSGNAPDKYRHVASLAQQGMSDQQIAEVLNISVPEATQLVSLSRIARND